MGAGALEVTTKRLPKVRVFDVRKLNGVDKAKVEELASQVWQNEAPGSWKRTERPGDHVERLDKFLLQKMGNPLSVEQIYRDLTETCRARWFVANNKGRAQKKKVNRDMGTVAEAIVLSISPFLSSRRFPEDFFAPDASSLRIKLPEGDKLHVTHHPLLNFADFTIINGATGELILKQQYGLAVAGVFLKALMLGRRDFVMPTEPEAADRAIMEFNKWFPDILRRINEACGQSAVGTKYEEELHAMVLDRLSVHPDVGKINLHGEFVVN